MCSQTQLFRGATEKSLGVITREANKSNSFGYRGLFCTTVSPALSNCAPGIPPSHTSLGLVYKPSKPRSSSTHLICGSGSCPEAGVMSQLVPHSVLTVPSAATALGLSWTGMRGQKMQNPTHHYQPMHCQPGSCSCNVIFLFNTQGF